MGRRTDLPRRPRSLSSCPQPDVRGQRQKCVCEPRPPPTPPCGPLSLRKLFSPEHRGYRVVCIRPLQFTQIQRFRGASPPACHIAGDNWILWLQLLCPFIPSGRVQPGTVRTGTPPFWVMVRQVPGGQEVRFRGVLGREKEPGGREADPAGQPVLQTVLGPVTGDHTEEGWTDVTALWLPLGLGGNLNLTQWSHQAGWRSRTGERVFSL